VAIWSVDGVTARDFIKDRHDRSGIAGAGDVVLLAVFAYMPPFDFVTFGCLSPLQPGGYPAFQDFPHFVHIEKFKIIELVVRLNLYSQTCRSTQNRQNHFLCATTW